MRRLDPQVRRRIEQALRRLAANDRSVGVRKLKGDTEWRNLAALMARLATHAELALTP